MGWMSWEDFRCEVDCAKNPDACINEALYKSMANRLRDDGYIAAGYRTISIDDCWESGTPGVLRSPGGPLQMNASRFPSGPKALADYIHARGAKFGIYSDEGTETCQATTARRASKISTRGRSRLGEWACGVQMQRIASMASMR